MQIRAFNRNSVNAKEKIAIEDFTHMNDSDLSNLDFAVRPPPPSLEILEVAFDPLNSEQQRHFIRNLIALRARLNAAKIGRDPKHHTELLEALTFSHQYLGKANQRRIHPSIRDIVRCVDLYTYFRTHPAYYAATKDCDTVSEQDRHRHALVLAIGFCYYFRLRQDLRAGYAAAFVKGGHVFPACKIPGSNVNADPFYWTFREVGMNLYRNTEFLEGVAPTNSFLQNLLLTVACIDAKIPLMIVGPPGCSKTLSFTIAIKNMQGNQSPQPFYRKLSHAEPLRYQCSKDSADTEIEEVYKNARDRQENFDNMVQSAKNQEGKHGVIEEQRVVVLLDEAGLPDERKALLKVLHYMLDHPRVSSVILSNNVLDAAKSNRAVILMQSTPSEEDLNCLAETCIYENDKLKLNKGFAAARSRRRTSVSSRSRTATRSLPCATTSTSATLCTSSATSAARLQSTETLLTPLCLSAPSSATLAAPARRCSRRWWPSSLMRSCGARAVGL